MMVYGLLSYSYVWCVVALLMFWSVLGQCIFSCIFHVHVEYIWFYSPMKILYIFLFVLITFYKALGLYTHVDRYCSLYVLHLMCVVYVELYCNWQFQSLFALHCVSVGRLLIGKRCDGRVESVVWWAGCGGGSYVLMFEMWFV
jgi:hypothetical protein